MRCPFCGAEMEPGELRLTGASARGTALVEPDAAWVPPPGRNAKGRLTRDGGQAKPLALELGQKTLRETLGLTPDVWSDRFYLQNAWYCETCRRAICVFEEPAPEPERPAPVQVTCPVCGTVHSEAVACPECVLRQVTAGKIPGSGEPALPLMLFLLYNTWQAFPSACLNTVNIPKRRVFSCLDGAVSL